MTASLATAFQQPLDACAATDVTALTAPDLRAAVVDLRKVAARLEAEIARFVHAATHTEAWKATGASSPEAWLAGATKSTKKSAHAQTRLASTLDKSPAAAAKMREGELSVDNASLLGAVVDHPAFEADQHRVLELTSGSPAETRKGLEHWLAEVDADNETDRDADEAAREHLTFTPDGKGMHDVSGKLTGASVAAVKAALNHIAGAQYADQTGRSHPKRMADALTELARAYNSGNVTGGRERPKLIVDVAYETIFERAAARGHVVGTDITLSADVVRAMACDAEIHRIITIGRSIILDMGSSTRLASESQWLALAARDGGCRWPTCERPAQWCEAHHIDEVIRHDGPTDLANLALFCSYHHHLLHSRRWSLIGNAHHLKIRGPDGVVLDAPPKGRHYQQLDLAS